MRPAKPLLVWGLALGVVACGGRDPQAERGSREAEPKLRISRRDAVAQWSVPAPAPALSDTLLRAPLPPDPSGGLGHAVFAVRAEPGSYLTATLESRVFDPYLIAADTARDGFRILEENDDRGTDPAAAVTLEMPAEAQVYLLITGTGEPGDYELRVRLEPPPRLQTGGDPAERYALLVGVGDYPGWEHDLPGVGTDLELMRRLLVDTFAFSEENILELRDHHASRQSVMEAFLTQLGRAGPNGVAVFYYSGHGIRLETNTYALPPLDPEADGRDEALFLGDGNILLDEEVGMLADRLAAERVLLILDSCYSGTGSRAPGVWLKRVPAESDRVRPERWPDFSGAPSPAPPREGADESAPDPGRHLLLSAAREDERAGVLAGLPGLAPRDTASVFTYHLSRILRESGGELSFRALTDSVRARTRETRSWSDVPDQEPGLLGRLAGASVDAFLAKRSLP